MAVVAAMSARTTHVNGSGAGGPIRAGVSSDCADRGTRGPPALPELYRDPRSEEVHPERLRAAGAADYATKPIDVEWLLDTITGCLPASATR
jgi:CheY-like chemotaxis protein